MVEDARTASRGSIGHLQAIEDRVLPFLAWAGPLEAPPRVLDRICKEGEVCYNQSPGFNRLYRVRAGQSPAKATSV